MLHLSLIQRSQHVLSLVSGNIVAADNTIASASMYTGYFEFINDPRNRLRTMTVPFQGGFELTVRV